MDFEWVALALGDVAWIFVAFVLGFAVRAVGLPPLVGFLATGFALGHLGIVSGEMLQKLADLGITLLLFSVGLKLKLSTLLRREVWLLTSVHIVIMTLIFSVGIFLLVVIGAPLFGEMDLRSVAILAFALSFSSTVFVVKALEEKGEMRSLHGRIAIGILVIQDLAAVIFLTASTGKLPSPWALLLFLLIPARPLLHLILKRSGHGELLILYGLVLALGGAELFHFAGVKDDLGALVMGMLISAHPKSTEMAKTMLGFKDLFLVGFFLSIGMAGDLTFEALTIAALLVPFMFVKSALFFALMTRFRMRARTAMLATINLTNYSEFGLIVAAIGVSNGWLDAEWLVVIAVALSLSFLVSAPLNRRDDRIYRIYRPFWLSFQGETRLADDPPVNPRDATIAIFGMGRVGTGAFDEMHELYGDVVIGVDFDAERVTAHRNQGRNVVRGAPSDPDFWEQMSDGHNFELVMLALPNLTANLDALEQLHAIDYGGRIAATARYPDEQTALEKAGATTVFNIYSEAGRGFASHVEADETAP